MPSPDPGNLSPDNNAALSGRRHRVPPDPDRPAALPHPPGNSAASPELLAAVCVGLRPGIPLLAMAHPDFIIGEPGPGRHGPTWTAIRKNPAQPGLYAAVTPDLAELRYILALHASQQPDTVDPGTGPLSGASHALAGSTQTPSHAAPRRP